MTMIPDSIVWNMNTWFEMFAQFVLHCSNYSSNSISCFHFLDSFLNFFISIQFFGAIKTISIITVSTLTISNSSFKVVPQDPLFNLHNVKKKRKFYGITRGRIDVFMVNVKLCISSTGLQHKEII